MVITRTPFRISFFGGGTDYPVWYQEHGGQVLSTTINKYCYISCRYLPPFFDHKYHIRYSKTENANSLDEIQHPSVRECLRFSGIDKGIEMVHTGDLPAQSGIASSSAFTVGFLNTLYALRGELVTKRTLATNAIHIEQEKIREIVGSQDQVATTFGGLNKIEFGGERKFYVQPITLEQEKLDCLQDHLMFFFTGFSRTASEIAKTQVANTHTRQTELHAMQEVVNEGIKILNGPMASFDAFGKLLHESWLLKKSLTTRITTSAIDDMYQAARDAGAIGGKLCGAGGGGFMLLFARPEQQAAIREKLHNLLYVPIRFESLGSQVIMYATQDFY